MTCCMSDKACTYNIYLYIISDPSRLASQKLWQRVASLEWPQSWVIETGDVSLRTWVPVALRSIRSIHSRAVVSTSPPTPEQSCHSEFSQFSLSSLRIHDCSGVVSTRDAKWSGLLPGIGADWVLATSS